jgi:hypothetical protein
VVGIYYLNTDECKEFKIILKQENLYQKELDIKTITNNNLKCKIQKVDCINHLTYLTVCNEKIRLDSILEINKIKINQIIVNNVSKKAIKGIVLVAFGGFIIIMITVLKDYI